VISADHDRGAQLAIGNHFIESEPEAVTVAQPDPADAGRQALEGDPVARHIEPPVQVGIIGQQLLDLLVCLVDVFRITREGDPAERADAPAEQRADVGGHETREIKGVFETRIEGDLSDIVAIVECGDARVPEVQHGLDLDFHRGAGGALDGFRIACLSLFPLGDGPADGEVTVDGVVGGRLICHQVWPHAAADQFGEDVCRIAAQADGFGLAGRGPFLDQGEGFVEAVGLFIEVAGAQPEIDTFRVALHSEAARACHGRR